MQFVAECVAAGAHLANSPARLTDIVTACIQAEATRRAGKLAAAAARAGAWGQAVAVAFASLLAVNQWRREAHGRREMEVAEACALALGGLISAIQTFRSSSIDGAEERRRSAGAEEANPFKRLDAAIARTLDRRQQELDAALRKFQESYSAAKLQIDFPHEDDHAAISARCNELRQLQLQIEPYIMQKFKGAELSAQFRRFHGWPSKDCPDAIGVEIEGIEARLMAELQMVFRRPSFRSRIRALMTVSGSRWTRCKALRSLRMPVMTGRR